MLEELEKKDYEDFFLNFFGYGNLNSNIWFIGIEEGSASNSILELQKRISVWKKLGKQITANCKEFHLSLGMGNELPFTKGNIQATWGRYIDLIRRIKKEDKLTKEEKREFQLNQFGGMQSDHCLLELFPIPCRDINSWPYKDLNHINQAFLDKKTFQNFIVSDRIKKIGKLLDTYKPSIVIFNSSGPKETLIPYWEKIINKKLFKLDVETSSGRNDFFFKNSDTEIKFYSLHNLKYEPDEVKLAIVKDYYQYVN